MRVCVCYTIFCLSPSVVPVWWLTVGDDFGADCWDGILDETIEEHRWRMLGDPQVGVWSGPPDPRFLCPQTPTSVFCLSRSCLFVFCVLFFLVFHLFTPSPSPFSALSLLKQILPLSRRICSRYLTLREAAAPRGRASCMRVTVYLCICVIAPVVMRVT